MSSPRTGILSLIWFNSGQASPCHGLQLTLSEVLLGTYIGTIESQTDFWILTSMGFGLRGMELGQGLGKFRPRQAMSDPLSDITSNTILIYQKILNNLLIFCESFSMAVIIIWLSFLWI